MYGCNVITTRRDKKFTRKDKTKMKQYDYLIVGSGLYGAVFAQQAMAKGKKVLVIDKRKDSRAQIRSPYLPYKQ